ncbi:MAG: hypothetical protein QM831_34820 [Kofleriaceae bacterium]
MLASSRSYAKELFVVAVLGVTTLVVASVRPAHHHTCRHHEARSDMKVVPNIYVMPSKITYAEPVRMTVKDQDIELEYQLASALQRAHDPKSSLMTQFEALRYARRLDLVLGGTRADGLDKELASVAPKAAVVYARSHNQEGLELALATCDSLGIAVDRKHF